MRRPDSTVVIPAAVPVDTAIAADFGNISPIRLPTRGTSLGARLWQTYRPLTSDIRFVLSSAEKEVVRAGGVFGLPTNVSIFSVERTLSLADSILAAFSEEPSPSGRLIVNFGDTLIPRRVCGEDRVVVAKGQSLVRWTTLGRRTSGSWQVFEKHRVKPTEVTHWILAGVFEFRHSRTFLDGLRHANTTSSGTVDPFFVALMRYLERSGPIDAEAVFEDQTNSWLDFGHIDSLHTSRLAIGGASRSFNVVKVDATKGLVTKRSDRSREFADERQWYFSLGDSLRHIAPRVLSSESDKDLTLEYYGYPTLQDLYLYSSLDLGDWEIILNKLGDVLEQLGGAIQEPGVDPQAFAVDRSEMYFEKTLRRMNESFNDEGLRQAWQLSRVNGVLCPTGAEIVQRLRGDLVAAGLLEPGRVGVIHGDFCLSNILFDRRSGVVRLIDPRGRFGSSVLHGDPLYDEAKLRHSFNGHYDFLVHELGSVSLGMVSAKLEVQLSGLQIEIREMFESWQQARLGDLAAAVRFVEALLFLSMVPLHADRPSAQIAFILRGRELYAQSIEVAE